MFAAPEAPMEIEFSPGTLWCTLILTVLAIIAIVAYNREG